MNTYKFDMHTHTTISDGKLLWKELLAYAKDTGLEGIAITDHNTIGPINEISEEAKKLGLKYIPGTEIKTTCQKQIEDYISLSGSNKVLLPTQELIIYGIDPNNEEFNEMSKKHLEGKRTYVSELCKLLKQHKTSELPGLKIDVPLEIDVENVFKRAGNYVGGAHIVEEIVDKYKQYAVSADWGKNEVKKLVIDTQKDAIKLMEDDPFYSLDIVEGLKKAKKWGKVVVLAHPFTESRKEMEKFYEEYLIPLLVKEGLDGIEFSYPEHNEEQMNSIQRIAEKHNLILTGGSDFHNKKDKLYQLGCCGVDESTFVDLEKRIK